MLEKALKGNRLYWGWMGILIAIIGCGAFFYLRQFELGLGITGLSRDVTWGFYIAQFTFLVGVAASAVMLVLPYYLHDHKAFGRITILGECLAIASVTMCVLFILVDMGQPMRLANIMLHPSPRSPMFWDMISLSGYLLLNLLIGWVTLNAERAHEHPPNWIRPIIYLSIPWAVSIHTVTAFLYSGLAARPFWMTAILAPRFLASAFSAGPALLILLGLLIRKITSFDPGDKALDTLSKIVAYAMTVNVFFVLMELFTSLYSSIPEHAEHFVYLYKGLEGDTTLVPWMWTSTALAVLSLVLLINPTTRRSHDWLAVACVTVFVSLWIDKGLAMVVAGFIPSPLGHVTGYRPTAPELAIALGIYAIGAFMITALYKIAISVRLEIES